MLTTAYAFSFWVPRVLGWVRVLYSYNKYSPHPKHRGTKDKMMKSLLCLYVFVSFFRSYGNKDDNKGIGDSSHPLGTYVSYLLVPAHQGYIALTLAFSSIGKEKVSAIYPWLGIESG